MDRLQAGDPSQIGSFRLLGRLGEGGMGRVFLGESPGGRKVAIKVVHLHYASDPEFRRRFAREVATARQVGGFHTAAVVGADPGADLPWMATAYIPGPSLAEAIAQRGPLEEAEVRQLGAALAEGLTAIHDCGLIHRDLKPSNVILAGDGPRIIDFGIAKGADATALTGSSAVIGTLRYMSPEQLNGHELTSQSDVFALGTVLAFAATGHDPFEAPTIPAVITRILTDPPDLDPLTGDLRGIIAGCLAKDPGNRPSPGDLLVRFSNHQTHDPTVTAAPAPAPAPGSLPAAVPSLEPRPAKAAGAAHAAAAAQEMSLESTATARPVVPPGRTNPSAPAARSAGDAPAGSEVPEAGERTARPAPPTSIVHAGPIPPPPGAEYRVPSQPNDDRPLVANVPQTQPSKEIPQAPKTGRGRGVPRHLMLIAAGVGIAVVGLITAIILAPGTPHSTQENVSQGKVSVLEVEATEINNGEQPFSVPTVIVSETATHNSAVFPSPVQSTLSAVSTGSVLWTWAKSLPAAIYQVCMTPPQDWSIIGAACTTIDLAPGASPVTFQLASSFTG